MKLTVTKFLSRMVSIDGNATNLTVISESMGVQLMKSNDKSLIENAYANHLSIINFTNCEKILKQHYNIPLNMSLIIQKIDFNAKLNANVTDTSSNNVSFCFYNPLTMDKLNLDFCNHANASIIVSVPLPNTSQLNITKLQELSLQGIDGLDPNSTIYTNRCFILHDPVTGKDTTPSFRSDNYLQVNYFIYL